MKKSNHAYGRIRRSTALCAAASGAVLSLAALPILADHGGPHVEPLASGTFLDDVSLTVRNKIAGRATHVTHVEDASDELILHITLDPGAIGGWHGHGEATGFLVNLGPGTLTNYIGDSCEPRQVYPGEAFVDPGHGTVHGVRNDSNEKVVLIAVFFGVKGAPVVLDDAPDDCTAL
ncbi:MAG: cupin domain-containing protein [Gammaproteobacteria bacterium]|jgi:quercetin dioxygenase-like cupin family protein